MNPSSVEGVPAAEGTGVLRRGQVGDWVHYFDSDRNEKWRLWIEENSRAVGLGSVKHIDSCVNHNDKLN